MGEVIDYGVKPLMEVRARGKDGSLGPGPVGKWTFAN
jgi:hypothetical protein